jgi:predicted metal-dependent phosphoesterase TrpH
LACNAQPGIDLHVHSNASDGSFSPADIFALAQTRGLAAVAITDHDTVTGAREALRIGPPSPLAFLPGIEISAAPPPEFRLSGSIHILGYGLDLYDRELNQLLSVLQAARENRNPAILSRLGQLGFNISLEEVLQAAGDGQAGRPHIARVMMEKGMVDSINEAFDNYLSQGRPAYVDKYRINSRQAIDAIRGAGGIAVLAHPYLLRTASRNQLDELVRSLKRMGLEGLEVHYPEHPPAETFFYERLARQYELLITGGTDFHGAVTPTIQIGCGRGDFFVPYRIYEALLDRLQRP